MGIYDREYYQDEDSPRGYYFSGQKRMLVTNLVLVTVALFVIDIFAGGRLAKILQLDQFFYQDWWKPYQLLTYGFVHQGPWHIALNMFLLWMFGRFLEERLGAKEFLLLYLAAIIFAGFVWALWMYVAPEDPNARFVLVGASGGAVAVFIVFVLYNPNQVLHLFGVVAVPAWILGAIMIGMDVVNAAFGTSEKTAWQAHLGGAAFAFLYVKLGLNLSRLVPSRGLKIPARKPKLRLHDPGREEELAAEADRILAKVHQEGEESLTKRERKMLEKYSRRVRDRRSDS